MPSDVLIIGAGPVGLTAAILLARHGLRVELVEKRSQPSSEPRAVALDDEALRIWQSCGLDSALREDWASGPSDECICTYLDDRDRAFLRIHQRTSDAGHPHAVAIHQGRIEEKLLRAAELHPLIRMHRGCNVFRIAQTSLEVTIDCTDTQGHAFTCSAPWAIACDGANSTVRRQLGIELVGADLPHPWLVANLVDRGEPGHVTIKCRANGASVTMPLPHGMRRVEVQLEEGDIGEWLHDDEQVRRRLMSGWDGAATAPIASRAVCRFKAVIAARWRERRVFLAGDAAHLMPPFAGQGLGSGLRDVANLCFKIAGVSQGWLDLPVLDSYEVERRPHLARITRLACRLGRLMMPRSRVESTLVQCGLRLIGASSALCGRWLLRGPSIRPKLAAGFFIPSEGAGKYLPQPDVLALDHKQLKLDDLLGPRMTWIVLAGGSRTTPQLQPPLLQPCDTVLMEGRDFRDPHLVLRRRYGAGGMILVRPDRIVYLHVPSARSQQIRRVACRPDPMSSRELRAAVPSQARSLSFPRSDASPTVPTRASNSAPLASMTSTPRLNSISSTPAGAISR